MAGAAILSEELVAAALALAGRRAGGTGSENEQGS